MTIRTEREAAGVSQAELARRIGMLQPKLSRIENGHIEASAGELALIDAALHEAEGARAGSEEALRMAEGTLSAASETLPVYDERPEPHLVPYPAAPVETGARRLWFERRNREMQERGVRAPESGTYGAVKKVKS
jgi:transcriptional regulator with XRE-family HTH domain